jgi:CzcA family heavy metal efflux pump
VLLRTEGQAFTADDLARVSIGQTGGTVVRLGDIADVVEGPAPRFGDALIQGEPGVLLTVSSQYGANTVDVTAGLEHALAELQPVFTSAGVRVFPRLHRPATFIETALGNLRFSLLLGALLVVAVLLPFLGHLRTTVISVTAIPLSLLGAVLVLERLGITLNTMTLGGLAIAIGEVVDDAIIDVENILRRLRLNAQRAERRPVREVVLEASLEVRGAVVYATFVVALVFVPLLTLSGVAGKFFAPLGLAYLLAVGTSLLVALTLTPALSLVLFRHGAPAETEPRLQTWLKRHYRAVLTRLMARPAVPVSAALLAMIAAGVALPFLGGGFLPEFREGHLVLQVSEAPGASLDELLRVGRQLSAELLAIPGVATVEQQVGRAERGEDTWGPHRSELHVELEKGLGRGEAAVVEQVRALLASFPGIQFEVLTFLTDRIGETLTGETAPVVVNVFGPDLDTIDAKAAEVARVLATVPGASEVRVKAPAGAPMLTVRLRPERLAQFGMLPADVLGTVRAAYQGETVAQVRRDNRQEDVVVVLAEDARHDPAQVGSLLVQTPGGPLLPLREVADIRPTSGRFSILHDGARRRQTVTCVPRGRDVASFVADAQQAVHDRLALPPGYYVEFGGTARAQSTARRELLVESGITCLGIVLLLWVAFQNARTVVLILANVPFGLVGGVLAAALLGWLGPEEGGLSMGSLVGFVTVLGITMRNSIMLVSHYRHLVHEEDMPWELATAIRGAVDRVVPILVTALVTGLGILPLALGVGTAGREIEGPMAIVILGGLASSTALNLLVLPPLAHRFGRFDDGRRAAPPA